MPETIALARLAIATSRVPILGLVAWATVGFAVTVFLALATGINSYPFFLLWMIPFGTLSLFLFEFSIQADLTSLSGTYSKWLLRMPIASWKLAMVPLGLRVIWIFGCWIATATFLRSMLGLPLPTWLGGATLSAVGIWGSAISWRPFRSEWTRGLVGIVAAIVLYAMVVFVFSAAMNSSEWDDVSPMLRRLGTYVGAITAVIGIGFAVRAVQLSRVNVVGMVPESSRRRERISRSKKTTDDSCSRIDHDFRNPHHALIWHDWKRLQSKASGWAVFILIPVLLFMSCALPATPVMAVFIILFFSYMGACLGLAILDETSSGSQSIPSYLATCPMTTREIAWTRAVSSAISSLGLFIVLATVFVSWGILDENRINIAAWFSQMTNQYGSPLAPIRLAAAAIVASLVLLPARLIASLWPTMMGQTRLQIASFVIPFLAVMAATVGWSFWMMKQTDLDSVTDAAWYWASWMPTLGVFLLVGKLIAVTWAAHRVYFQALVDIRNITQIVILWTILTLTVSGVIYGLIPDPRVTFAWCGIATALTIPLARFLILPYAVHCDRHR